MPHIVTIKDRFGHDLNVLTIPDHKTPAENEALAIAADEFQRAATRLYAKAYAHATEEIERGIDTVLRNERGFMKHTYAA